MKIKEVLEKLEKKYGKFKVAYQYHGNKKRFWEHLDYPSPKANGMVEDITDRHVMDDEIVIETDMNLSKINRSVTNLMLKIIQKKFNYKCYFSGGKSYHIHLIFPELMSYKDDRDRMLMKRLFARWIFGCPMDFYSCSGCDTKLKITTGQIVTCGLIRYKLDMNLMGKHMIRIEGAEHPNTGIKKRLYKSCDDFSWNKLPIEVIERFKRITKVFPSSKKFTNGVADKDCVKLLMNTDLKDGRKRAAFIIYNNLKLKYDNGKAEDLFKQWCESIKLDKMSMMGVIHSGKDSDRAPGCAYNKSLLREIGLKCPCEVNNGKETKTER